MQPRYPILPLALGLLAACADRGAPASDSPVARTDTTGLPVGVVTMGTPQPESASTLPPLPTVSAAGEAAWFAEADSVMRAHLQRSLYTSPGGYIDDMEACEGDMGSDNPLNAVAVARARIVRHDSLTVYYHFTNGGEFVAHSTWYAVELTSAARMVPNWIAGVTYRNDSVPGDEAYVMEVGPQVDTVVVRLEDLRTLKPRWAVCTPNHPRAAEGQGFWMFANESKRWQTPVLWRPADASWARIRALADSLAGPATPER